MLFRHQLYLITAILLLHLYRDSTALKPNIFLRTDEIINDQIIKKEGDSLRIKCSGESNIVFMYPINSTELFNTSAVEINKTQDKNGTYTYEFVRPNTVYGDTGWYGCSDHFIEVSARNYSDPEVDWIYVFVQSEKHHFVEKAGKSTLHAVQGGSIIIPCRPTSPTAEVTHDSYGEVIDNKKFDPKVGFTLYNVTPHMKDTHVCIIANENRKYYVDVSENVALSVPIIINDTLRNVKKGETLYVNCTTSIQQNVSYEFKWIPPQQSNRITTRNYTVDSGTGKHKITRELIIKNVTFEDAGVYKCEISHFNTVQKSETNITVHKSIDPYINLTSQNPNRHQQHRLGKTVQWVVEVDAYPLPKLKWFDTKGDEIPMNSSTSKEPKFSVNVTCCKPMLRINRLAFDDMGIYSIEARNNYKTETLNFTLDVIDKPIVNIGIRNPSPYLFNEEAWAKCYVESFPMPNITWSYRKCPKFSLCENITLEHLMNYTMENGTKKTTMVSTVFATIEMSGQLICSACNIVGCGNASETVMVSDVAGGFGVIPLQDPVVEGDDLELICAASIYNYSNIFYWSSQSGLIEQNDRIVIAQGETQYTYRSILKIRDVKIKDSQVYTCTGKSTTNISTEYPLEVKAARASTINSTNLDKEDLIIDDNTPSHRKVDLKCKADGMPKPSVTWFKDGIQLASNERYNIHEDDQALEIRFAEEIDSGEYMCQVKNRINQVEARRRITIKGKGLPVGLIVLVIILAVVVVILVIYFAIKVRRERILRRELLEAGLMHFEKGAVDCLNPELTVDDQAELLPYDNTWEFPREKLRLGRQLGSGAFGVVLKGEAEGICRGETVTTVAVKMVRRTTNVTYVRALSSELKILVHLGKHLNVVNLLGACTKNIMKRELLVIVEYCRFGNLHNYLLRHRGDFINQIDPATGKFDPSIGLDLLARTSSTNSGVKYANLSFSRSISCNSESDSVQFHPIDNQGVSMSPDGPLLSNGSSQPGWSSYRGDYKDHNLKPICSQDLLSWAFQVARGMEYLSQRRVLHGDLASRNILLAENNVVKICDFGLGKTLYKEDNYQKKSDGPLPIKWLAIESIRDRIFSTQSDIWSFGIVLWEFFTLAETPYPGMEAEIQYQKLIEGYRMEQPEYATLEVYNLMRQCWKAKPTLRPSFAQLVDNIGNLLEDSVKSYYIQLNSPYVDMNAIQLKSGKDDYLTMLSAPDHVQLSSPTNDYMNSPTSEAWVDPGYLRMTPRKQNAESGIFSPRPNQECTHFEFPSSMTDLEDNVGNRVDVPTQDSGYCKMTVANSNLTAKMSLDLSIIKTNDNYLRTTQKSLMKKENLPSGVSNPNYVIMANRC